MNSQFKMLFRFTITFAVTLTVLLSGLLRQANAASPVTYTVAVGSFTPYGIEVLAFGPQTLKVHRGDTVKWLLGGPHNIHFHDAPLKLTIKSKIDGKDVVELNPEILMPTVKSGDKQQAGANSGLPLGPPPGNEPPSFSLVMDLAPGSYTYICDIHPGMIGFIQVEEDATAVSSPDEVTVQGKKEFDSAIANAEKGWLELLKKPAMPAKDGAEVAPYAEFGTAIVSQFFPQVTTIQPGLTVTWKMPAGIISPVAINFPLSGPMMPPAMPMMDSNKMPHFVLGPDLIANIQSGADFPKDGVVHSGILEGGQSFTLKFNEPGRYAYYNGFGNQIGAVIVMPAQSR